MANHTSYFDEDKSYNFSRRCTLKCARSNKFPLHWKLEIDCDKFYSWQNAGDQMVDDRRKNRKCTIDSLTCSYCNGTIEELLLIMFKWVQSGLRKHFTWSIRHTSTLEICSLTKLEPTLSHLSFCSVQASCIYTNNRPFDILLARGQQLSNALIYVCVCIRYLPVYARLR